MIPGWGIISQRSPLKYKNTYCSSKCKGVSLDIYNPDFFFRVIRGVWIFYVVFHHYVYNVVSTSGHYNIIPRYFILRGRWRGSVPIAIPPGALSIYIGTLAALLGVLWVSYIIYIYIYITGKPYNSIKRSRKIWAQVHITHINIIYIFI